MNTELVRKIGSVEQDNLIVRLTPAAETFGVVIRKTEAETVLKRGTLLGKSSADGKLIVYGTAFAVESEADAEAKDGKIETEEITPFCVLADDVAVGAAADAVGVAYRSGNFNRSAIITADGYTLTDKDEDELRKFDIIFTDTI